MAVFGEGVLLLQCRSGQESAALSAYGFPSGELRSSFQKLGVYTERLALEL